MITLASDRPRWTAVRRFSVALATAVVSFGCAAEPTAPTRGVGGIRVDAAWVTTSVAGSVNTVSGMFILPPAVPRTLTELAADSISIGVARIVGDTGFSNALRAELERIRASTIPFLQLRPCARTIYAPSPFEEPPSAAPGWLRRGLASQWAVQMCDPRSPDVLISVMIPDAPRDFVVDNETIVVSSLRQFGGGADWFVTALPSAFVDGLLLTPEEAVRTAFLATTVRISSVPMPLYQWDDRLDDNRIASHVSWLLSLEQPIQVRNKETNTVQVVTELIVQRRHPTQASADYFIPASVQPTQRWFSFRKDTTGTSASTALDSVSVRVRGHHRFNAVEIVR